jgi:hypothetical protein
MKLRVLLAVIALPALAHAEPTEVISSADACAVASPVARYLGMGYSHVVSLKNGCSRTVTCEVWTDVDPQPRYTLSAQPGETVEVVTRRGSPAREFKVDKSCKY